jgi:hypothetical protein
MARGAEVVGGVGTAGAKGGRRIVADRGAHTNKGGHEWYPTARNCPEYEGKMGSNGQSRTMSNR